MKKYKIEQLAKIIGADIPKGWHPLSGHSERSGWPPGRSDGFITSVSTDSRNIKKGDCFFAIKGTNFDGHDYIDEVFEKGAACAVVEKGYKLQNCHCEPAQSGKINFEGRKFHILEADSTVKSLGKLANYYRNDCDFKVIAITGSVGKTTTRHIIANVLSSKYKVHQSPKSFNNEIGLPVTILGAEPDTEIIVAEIGANNPGEIQNLSNIAEPDIAIVTNIHPSHLEGFGSIRNIIEEKLAIVSGLRPKGKFFINSDFQDLVDKAKNKEYTFDTFSQDDIDFKSPIPGKGNLENISAAWKICQQFEITKIEFEKALIYLPTVPMRAEVKQFGAVTVIDDCYNANPASMKNALEILSSYKDSRKVFICGDMLELGRLSEKFHKDLATDIKNANVNLLLTVGPFTKITAGSVADNIQTQSFENTEQLNNNLDKFTKDNDIVLVKGSRSIGMEKVVRELKNLFDKSSLVGN